MPEIWQPIPGYDGAYEASDQGRIRSNQRRPGALMRPSLNRGYEYVGLCRDGIPKTIPVHRLVALTFHGPLPHGMETRHLDGNRRNNAASNLAYGTAPENRVDSVLHGTHNNASKVRCPAGHPYDAINTVHTKGGRRECRTCRTERNRRSAALRRGVAA
jgi:hypothetical protein